MLRRLVALTSTALLLAGLTSCSTTDAWVIATAAQGWSAQYSDAANSSYTPIAGASELTLQWSRSVKGTLGAGVALGADGYLAANGQTAAGCSLMVWENDNHGRQRWCTRMVLGGGFASPLFDGFDNVYIGQPGMMLSFPPTQWIRWRHNVIGMPTTARFLGGGQLLVVTHLGQVLVFDAHRGRVIGTPLDLVDGLDPTDSTRGLTDCPQAGAQCPVAAAPAFSPSTQLIVLGLWQPAAKTAVLTALKYHPGEIPLLTRQWTTDEVTAGILASPVLSDDGATVYVTGRDERLWAFNSSDGTLKWFVELGFQPHTPPSASPNGLIIAGGGPGSQLIGLQDAGDHADIRWRRSDISPLSTSSQAGADTGYTVVDDSAGLSLLVFDLADGHTITQYRLDHTATGFPLAVAVGYDRRVVVATSEGHINSFAPTQ